MECREEGCQNASRGDVDQQAARAADATKKRFAVIDVIAKVVYGA